MNKIKAGTLVRSRYKSPWIGVVVASGHDHSFKITTPTGWFNIQGMVATSRNNRIRYLDYNPVKYYTYGIDDRPFVSFRDENCILVKVTHDRNGNWLRKPLWKVLHEDYLEPLSKDDMFLATGLYFQEDFDILRFYKIHWEKYRGGKNER